MTPPNKLSRRGFLVALTGSAVAAAAGCRPSGVIPPTAYAPGSGARPTNTPRASSSASSVLDANYGNVTYDKMILTNQSQLYVTQYDYTKTPALKAEDWSLSVQGLVENPVTLDYATLKTFPVYEDMRTLECIGNPLDGELIGNLMWKGFRFDEILKRANVKPNATHAKFWAADGYTTSVELKWITQPDVMMAYEVNGEPLSPKHGFPLRILMPGLYGQKMPRWITTIEFVDHYYQGYWESNGWSDVASVQTNSIIMTPPDGYSMQAGTTVALQGVAWAGTRKITKVEVQIDNGDWTPAHLTQGPSPRAWTQWYLPWTPAAPGSYRIGVRASDETGFVQNAEADSIFGDSAPNGTSAIPRISLQAT